MMRLRFLVPVLGLSSLIAVACGEDTDVGSGGDAGAGGEGGEATAPGASGAAGEATGVGGGCADTGSGTLVIEVEGLPAGVAPSILIEGPDDLLADSAGGAGSGFEGVAAGAYKVTAERVFDEDPIVRSVFDPTVTAPDFCLADGDSHTIKVSYEMIPSSNKLWLATGLDDELAAFSSFQIADSGMTAADVDIDGPGTGALAFDRDGNLWAFGPGGSAQVARFPAAVLGESGTREPDVAFNLMDLDCAPPLANLAFDPEGNLWLSSFCKGDLLGELHRIPADELTTPGDTKESDIVITGLDENDGLAFDASGNVWVAGGAKLVRYDAARLAASDSDPADLSLSVTAAVADTPIVGVEIAFDKAGNLWAVSRDNLVFQIAKANLAGTGDKDVQAKVSFHLDPLAIAESIAFDDSGNLWLTLLGGEFGGFSPAQQGMSTGTGENVTPAILISSDSIATGLPLAFFPAPAGLPLYHSLPAE